MFEVFLFGYLIANNWFILFNLGTIIAQSFQSIKSEIPAFNIVFHCSETVFKTYEIQNLQVVLQNIDDPKVIYYFLLHGWLAKDVGNGHLWREIRAKKKLAKEITTGDGISSVCVCVSLSLSLTLFCPPPPSLSFSLSLSLSLHPIPSFFFLVSCYNLKKTFSSYIIILFPHEDISL